jgi:hypothetical protein
MGGRQCWIARCIRDILFLTLLHDERPANLEQLLQDTSDFNMGVVLYAQHALIGLEQEKEVNVWLREQGSKWMLGLRMENMDLALLLANQLARNWKCRNNLCMAVDDPDTSQRAEEYLKELITVAHLPAKTQVKIYDHDFWDALSQAPTQI